MKTSRPTVSDWEKHPAISKAGTKGFNPLDEIPKALREEHEWLEDFEFGFSTKGDIPTAIYAGWKHLLSEWFEVEDFNTAIGLRFGIQNDGGVLKIEENYIMIMPKDERARVQWERNEAFEDHYRKIMSASGIYTDKGDPDAEKMRARLTEKYPEDYGLEEKQFSVAPPKEKKRRGRPPGSKNK